MTSSHLYVDLVAFQGRDSTTAEEVLRFLVGHRSLSKCYVFVRANPEDRRWIAPFVRERLPELNQRVLVLEPHQDSDERFLSLLARRAIGEDVEKVLRFPPQSSATVYPRSDTMLIEATTSLLSEIDGRAKVEPPEDMSGLFVQLKERIRASTLDVDVKDAALKSVSYVMNVVRLDHGLCADVESRSPNILASASWLDALSPKVTFDSEGQVKRLLEMLEPILPGDCAGLKARLLFCKRGRDLDRKLKAAGNQKGDVSDTLIWWSAYMHYAASILAGDKYFSSACAIYCRSLELYLMGLLVNKGLANVTFNDVHYLAGTQPTGLGSLFTLANRELNLSRLLGQRACDDVRAIISIRNSNIVGHWLLEANQETATFVATTVATVIRNYEGKMGGIAGIEKWKSSTKLLSQQLLPHPSTTIASVCLSSLLPSYGLF